MEALSRGAARVVFVERAAAALKVLRGNLAGLGLKDGTVVRAESVGAFLRRAFGSLRSTSFFLIRRTMRRASTKHRWDC